MRAERWTAGRGRCARSVMCVLEISGRITDSNQKNEIKKKERKKRKHKKGKET